MVAAQHSSRNNRGSVEYYVQRSKGKGGGGGGKPKCVRKLSTAGGNINLKKCAACELVRYCNVECQREHRPRHKKACKKRAKELHDKQLFTQPDCSHLGECHICFLPLPLDRAESVFHPCCSETICKGCVHANMISN